MAAERPPSLPEHTVPTGPPEHGGAGVTAAAAVPFANRATPGQEGAPAFTPQPRVYRATAPPELPTRTPGEVPPAAQPPRQRQPWLPVYSDLLSPAAPEPGPATPGPHHPPPPQPMAPAARPGEGQWGAPGQATAFAQQPGMSAGPGQPYPPPDQAGGHHVPQQRSPAPEPGAPAAPGAEADDDPEKTGPRTGVIVAVVLVSATALVLITLGAAFGLSRLSQSSDEATYNVGECVVRDGDLAEPAGCDEPDAYEIVSQVDTRNECPDPSQPAIEVRGDTSHYYCLANAAAGEDSGSEDGEDGAGEDGDGSDEQ